jgi:hypothetical protein
LDSAETSFGSSFDCFELKLVSKDTLSQTVSVKSYYKEQGEEDMMKGSHIFCNSQLHRTITDIRNVPSTFERDQGVLLVSAE